MFTHHPKILPWADFSPGIFLFHWLKIEILPWWKEWSRSYWYWLIISSCWKHSILSCSSLPCLLLILYSWLIKSWEEKLVWKGVFLDVTCQYSQDHRLKNPQVESSWNLCSFPLSPSPGAKMDPQSWKIASHWPLSPVISVFLITPQSCNAKQPVNLKGK